MNMSHACNVPQDAGYLQCLPYLWCSPGCRLLRCRRHQSGTADVGEEVELARYELHPQYCGALLYFAQYAEQQEPTQGK